jgi:hypothetical protein
MSELVERLFSNGRASLARAPAEIGGELKSMVAHGAHELAAALFSGGGAFVMYARGGREDAIETPMTPALEEKAELKQELSL